MKHPFFSIIVPIYNSPSAYFEKCIDSLLEQSYRDIEILLIDDGSEAACATMCDQYAERDDRVRVIHQENAGVSAARNRGIEEASADWIMFVDADDWLDLNTCEKLHETLAATEYDMLIFGAAKEYADQSKPMKYGLESGKKYDFSDVATRERFYRRAMGTPMTENGRLCVIYFSWDKVYRREFLMREAIRYPVGIPKSEDKVFILSCFEKLGSLVFIQDVFYHYRINDASICNRYSATADSDRRRLAETLRPIAERMDAELGQLKGDGKYDRIMREYNRFVFGIVSDVLLLKYYHEDNPSAKNRRAEAKEFLRSKPFAEAMRQCKYRDLTRDAKVKKALLSLGFIGLYCRLKIKRKNARGVVAAE